MYSRLGNFSHIYVENDAAEYPMTRDVLSRFSKLKPIYIDSYKETFNRARQEWRTQKNSQKLILAKKREEFVYKSTDIAPRFGYEHFYYTTPVLNCLYDCHYCYLQGLYPSANMVVFVNTEDFFSSLTDTLKTHSPLYLCISYDTDLMAVEDFIPWTSEWVRYSATQPDLLIEVRTKSAYKKIFDRFDPLENVVFAWTFSPQQIIDRYEARSPSLKARLKAAAEAQAKGWKIRICIDPIVPVEGWRNIYADLVKEIFSQIDPAGVRDLTYGSFRMNTDFLKKIKKQGLKSDILYQPYLHEDGISSWPKDVEKELFEYIEEVISKYPLGFDSTPVPAPH